MKPGTVEYQTVVLTRKQQMRTMHGEASYKLQVSQNSRSAGPLPADVSIYDGRKF
jgi:hypothetical protein